jgi:hypothetical protein
MPQITSPTTAPAASAGRWVGVRQPSRSNQARPATTPIGRFQPPSRMSITDAGLSA